MHNASIRPSKVDLLFPISHFLNFDAGGRAVIIHYDITVYLILQCILKYFFTLQAQIQEFTNQLQILHLKQIQVMQPGAFHKD